jgi:hypothetical protein
MAASKAQPESCKGTGSHGGETLYLGVSLAEQVFHAGKELAVLA